jgi:transcriptional regulator with XRE-family HTH domain
MQNASTLRAAMAQLGLGQKDLAALLGSRPRASEILHGKRGISTAQALKLHQAWGIPLHTLLNPAARPNHRSRPSRAGPLPRFAHPPRPHQSLTLPTPSLRAITRLHAFA